MSRVVVITGAGAGVGRAAARAFAARGDRVALIGRGEHKLRGAARDVEAEGGTALVLPCDVADADAVEAAAQRAEDVLGPIDVWVNNAMTAALKFVHETGPDEFRRVMETNFHGTVHGTQAALRRMRPRDRGTIVQVGSSLAYRAIPLQATYCASKFAVRGFTDSLRCELLHEGSKVQLTMVQLPGLNTPQFTWVRTSLDRHPMPVPPIYQPEVAADAIVHASLHQRREHWVGGMNTAIMVGSQLLPWLGDLYLGRGNVEAQQTDVPIDPDAREDYLFSPVEEDRGAHGPFDADAKDASRQWQVAKAVDRVLDPAAAVLRTAIRRIAASG